MDVSPPTVRDTSPFDGGKLLPLEVTKRHEPMDTIPPDHEDRFPSFIRGGKLIHIDHAGQDQLKLVPRGR